MGLGIINPYNILTPAQFIGFENYAKMFIDIKFIASLAVTSNFVPFQIALFPVLIIPPRLVF